MFERVLLVGGAGLVGSTLTDMLIAEGVGQVVILDDLSKGSRHNLARAVEQGSVQIIEGDIRRRRDVAEAMVGVDIVFHLAAVRITRVAEEPRLGLEVLVDGAFNVFESAAEAGARVVASSSASVYGLAEHFPTTEFDHPYDNRTLYGAAKLFNEGLLRAFHDTHGLDYVALRYFNVYGPRMDTYGAYTEVLVRWMERIEAGQPPIILGDGTQTMDFVFVEDVARANLLAARSSVSDEVFNIATGVETSLRDLAMLLLRAMGSDLEPEYGPERKANPVQRRLADTTKAREVLGFEARIGLEDGLDRLVDWWRVEGAALSQSGGRS